MKKSLIAVIASILASAAYVGRGQVATSRQRPEPQDCKAQKYVEFKEQEGIKKLIKDYKLIKAGESKKGQLKQNRIVGKINWLIEQGILEPEDLTIK